MIYAVEKEDKVHENIESFVYQDRSGLSWHVQRTEVGLYISYLGPKNLIPRYFECKVNGNVLLIRNTNFIHIRDTDFETFFKIRNIIIDGFIDQIWSVFASFFTSRLKLNPVILQTEMSK